MISSFSYYLVYGCLLKFHMSCYKGNITLCIFCKLKQVSVLVCHLWFAFRTCPFVFLTPTVCMAAKKPPVKAGDTSFLFHTDPLIHHIWALKVF